MKAIIMAGGFGTRLRPLTINIPKPMVPIGNLPMMEHVVCLLKRHGITDITALLYFQPEKIRDYFGDGSRFGVHIGYVIPDQDYGTAGAVRFALERADEPILVISGDLVTDFDLSSAMNWHKQAGSQATLLLTRMDNPLAYGIVITSDEGRIIRFLEKPSWGEAFSDTINTGIYILEPAAIQMVPPRTNFDFSQNLFPLMLQRQMGLFGHIMDGYWRDVGNVDEYRNVHVDLFDGKIDLTFGDSVQNSGDSTIVKGKDVTIGEDVTISGKVFIGDNVVIENGAQLTDCAIAHNSIIGRSSSVKRSIIWSGTSVGVDAEINSAIVCSRVRVGDRVMLNEHVIVSDDCTLGLASTVKANCKLWPGKKVDAGAIVSHSLVWGDKWNRELFTHSKITGLALTEITPEMTVRVGAAFGAFLGRGAAVVTSRDASDISRLLKRGMISGLLAAGVNVDDFETMPIPVVRYGLRKGNYAAGLYVRHSPEDYREIECIFFDGNGTDMPSSRLKKIERMYFSEDFERASLDDIGHLDAPRQPIEEYKRDFMASIDVEHIRKAGFKVVVDHSNGSSSEILPRLFSGLGISAVQLNASLDPRKFSTSHEEQEKAVSQLSAIVTSLNADVGLMLNSAAEKLIVVDETGHPIDAQTLLLIFTELYLRVHHVKRIAVTVDSSMGVEEIARARGVDVVRVANDHLAMMEINRRGEADFVGGTRGGYIFPGFQMGADGMLSSFKLLELMAKTETKLSVIRKRFEHLHRRTISVPCPWAKKGTVMRKLITGTADKTRQLIDGIRIFEDGGWVLVIPDSASASFNIVAESRSDSETSRLIQSYSAMVNEYQVN
ncbi:MAG: sugar phosphate nucleotidyltransferase [Candidatus Zixiibacteriota bacterium]